MKEQILRIFFNSLGVFQIFGPWPKTFWFRKMTPIPIKALMKHSLAWIEKFITPEQQNELMQLPPDKQLETLCDLIESGQLEAASYLEWASNFYLLPSLDSEFFKQVDISETWKKYNGLAAWSPEIVQIQEWDNRRMIAGRMPLSDFRAKIDLQPQFLTGSPADF